MLVLLAAAAHAAEWWRGAARGLLAALVVTSGALIVLTWPVQAGQNPGCAYGPLAEVSVISHAEPPAPVPLAAGEGRWVPALLLSACNDAVVLRALLRAIRCAPGVLSPSPRVSALLPRRSRGGRLKVPESLRRLHQGWEWSVAWAQFPGVATYRLDGPAGEMRFLKLSSTHRAVPVQDECARTRWAAAYLPVPEVIACGADGPVEWMLTRGVDVPDATSPALRADPAALVGTLARGLSHEPGVGASSATTRLARLSGLLSGAAPSPSS